MSTRLYGRNTTDLAVNNGTASVPHSYDASPNLAGSPTGVGIGAGNTDTPAEVLRFSALINSEILSNQFPVSLVCTTLTSGTAFSFRITRRNAAGTTLATSAVSPTFTSTGTHTATLTLDADWQVGSYISVEILHWRQSGHGGNDFQINANNANTYLDVEFGEPAEPDTYDLNMTVVGNGSVQQDPQPPYEDGQQVQLTAVPDSGWEFTNWSGDIGGASATDPQITVTMNQDRNITANFDEESEPDPPPDTGDVKTIVAAYYPNYQRGTDPGETSLVNFNWGSITHLIDFSVGLRAGRVSEDWVDNWGTPAATNWWNPTNADQTVAAAHAQGKYVMLCLGNQQTSDSFNDSLDTQAKIDQVAVDLADLVATHGYDGVDFDGEPALDIVNYQDLIIATRLEFESRGWRTPGPNYKYLSLVCFGSEHAVAKDAIQNGVDWVTPMLYVPWEDTSRHLSPIRQSGYIGAWHQGMENWITGTDAIPKSMVTPGLAFYVRRWPGVTGPNQSSTADWEEYDWHEFQHAWGGIDAPNATWYGTSPPGSATAGAEMHGMDHEAQWYSFESGPSIQSKALYIEQEEFAGVALWHYQHGSLGNDNHPLAGAVEQHFGPMMYEDAEPDPEQHESATVTFDHEHSIGLSTSQQEDTGAPSTSYRDAVLALGPALYYELNETSGTVAEDASPTGRDGTISGGLTLGEPSLLPSGEGTSILSNMDGAVTRASESSDDTPSHTLAGWARIDTQVESVRIFGRDEHATSKRSLMRLSGGAGGTARFRAYNGAGTTVTIDVPIGPYDDGQPHFYVGVMQGGTNFSSSATMRLYVDGVEVGTLSIPNQYISGNLPPFEIASVREANDSIGGIDQIAYFRRALSAGEVLALYEASQEAGEPPPPPPPTPESLTVVAEGGGLRVSWQSEENEFILEREVWTGEETPL